MHARLLQLQLRLSPACDFTAWVAYRLSWPMVRFFPSPTCRCHFTLGNSIDAFKSLELARTAWEIATGGEGAEPVAPADLAELPPFSRGVLKPGGSLVMKLLQGAGEGGTWRRAGGQVGKHAYQETGGRPHAGYPHHNPST
jgi:hypothetical protein